jgi:hypothetical protein
MTAYVEFVLSAELPKRKIVWAGWSSWEGWELAWVCRANVWCAGCCEGVSGIGEDEAKVAVVASS